VAVKVRHPHMHEIMSRDFTLMAAAASLSEWVPWLSQLRLQQTIAQFRTPLVAQVRRARSAQYTHTPTPTPPASTR